MKPATKLTFDDIDGMISEIEKFEENTAYPLDDIDRHYIPTVEELKQNIEPDFRKSIKLETLQKDNKIMKKIYAKNELEESIFYVYYFIYLLKVIENSEEPSKYKDVSKYLQSLIYVFNSK